MLIVAGTFTIDPQERAAALEYATDVMRATREEEGCHEYVFSADPLDPAAIKLYELWESADALAAHFETDHLKAFQAGLGQFTITGSELLRYEIASVGPLT